MRKLSTKFYNGCNPKFSKKVNYWKTPGISLQKFFAKSSFILKKCPINHCRLCRKMYLTNGGTITILLYWLCNLRLVFGWHQAGCISKGYWKFGKDLVEQLYQDNYNEVKTKMFGGYFVIIVVLMLCFVVLCCISIRYALDWGL